jgi:hypothetical protein
VAAAEEGSAFFGGREGDKGLGHEVGVVEVALFDVPACELGEGGERKGGLE